MYVLSSTRFIVDSSSSVMISQKIFEKICTYLVNPKILGGPWPSGPPTNEATGTEQGQALPSSTEQGQALACFLHEIFLTNFS